LSSSNKFRNTKEMNHINIRILSKEKIYEIEQDQSYWNRVAHEAQRQIEDEWLSCIKIWDFIEDTTTQCQLPSLGPLKKIHPTIKYCKI
jgi:hypothetical protein